MDTKSTPVRFSNLKQMRLSPAHCYAAMTGPEFKQSTAMLIGSAVDALIYGTSRVVRFDGTRRGKAWDEFRAENDGALIVTDSEWDRVRRMADAVLANPEAARVLRGENQRRLTWTRDGRDCVGTPDTIGDGFVTDLKTTKFAKPEWFTRDALRWGYHAQLAWYMDAVVRCHLGKPETAFIVAVESSPPHPVVVLELTERALDMGNRLCRQWWETFLVCERSGEWPGYVQGIISLDVPDEDDFDLSFGDEVAA